MEITRDCTLGERCALGAFDGYAALARGLLLAATATLALAGRARSTLRTCCTPLGRGALALGSVITVVTVVASGYRCHAEHVDAAHGVAVDGGLVEARAAGVR